MFPFFESEGRGFDSLRARMNFLRFLGRGRLTEPIFVPLKDYFPSSATSARTKSGNCGNPTLR